MWKLFPKRVARKKSRNTNFARGEEPAKSTRTVCMTVINNLPTILRDEQLCIQQRAQSGAPGRLNYLLPQYFIATLFFAIARRAFALNHTRCRLQRENIATAFTRYREADMRSFPDRPERIRARRDWFARKADAKT